MGYYSNLQKSICLYTMLALLVLIVFKYFRINTLSQVMNYEYYLEHRKDMNFWGYVLNVDEAN